MLSDGAIHTEHIWKRFKSDHRMLLRDELQRFAHLLRGQRGEGWRWALRDIGFDIDPGESVGLIGINGSGKTTLLKILSRVMFPYAGKMEVGGRLGALINVTGGLHEDLTGRENVFIYGSLLGWNRKYVASRFDEIVAFAELGEAIDRQVKFYSQGMKMRLAFAIAAMLEPNVLLVDEVLAVGDAWFQKKCLDRMREILDAGTTIVYVSHDLATVQAMCKRTMWMSDGVIVADGPSSGVIEAYLRSLDSSLQMAPSHGGPIEIAAMAINGLTGRLLAGSPMVISLDARCNEHLEGTFYLGASQTPVAPAFVLSHDITLEPGDTHVTCAIPHFPLPGGNSHAWAGFVDKQGKTMLPFQPVANFEVQGPPPQEVPSGVVMGAPIFIPAEWRAGGEDEGSDVAC